MRIAWCTPFDRRSAIGRASSLVVRELLRLAEVDVWYPTTTDAFETPARCITPLIGGPADVSRLETYDFAVYNMGNHLCNHREIFEVSRKVPGLVVLHDIVLQDFFSAYYLQTPGCQDRYIAAVRRWYGPRGIQAVQDLVSGVSGDLLDSPAVLEFPLFEEAIAGAYAVLTHSVFSADRVRAVFPGLVRSLPLPYDPNHKLRIAPRDSLRVPAGRLLAVTVGDVNPNKRIAAVLEVLGGNPALASRIFYVVIGQPTPDYEPQLKRLVKQYALEETVRFLGYAPGELLADYLAHADFCINLRYPARETASASAIEQLSYGKPLIVSKTGFYEEIPDDCVLKLRLDHEVEDLASALRLLVDDSVLRQLMGKRARIYARDAFRADRYARGIVELGDELLDAKPLLAYSDRVGRELGRMGVSSDLAVISTVASVSSNLFGK